MKRAKSTPENLIIKLIIKKKLSNKSSHQTSYKKTYHPYKSYHKDVIKVLKPLFLFFPNPRYPTVTALATLGQRQGCGVGRL